MNPNIIRCINIENQSPMRPVRRIFLLTKSSQSERQVRIFPVCHVVFEQQTAVSLQCDVNSPVPLLLTIADTMNIIVF